MSIPITDKYLLYKPGLGNEADIRVLNHNTDNIDNGMYQNRRMIGDTYNPESTAEHPYMKGDLVVKQTTILDENDNPVSYSFQYYKCLQDNTYGPWDPTKWESTDVATELKLGGGGASSLADLTDTDIDSPTNGQALIYNEGYEMWENQTLPDPSVTKEASGNPIELSDSASAPLVKCVTQITGSQDLHGYDKPWVGGAGKNKLALTVTDFKVNNISGTWSGNVYTYLGCKYTLNTDDGGNVISIGVEYSDQSTDVALPFSLKAGSYVLTSGFSEDNGVNDSYLQKNGVTIARGNGASPGNQFKLSEDSTVVWHLRVTNKNYTAYPMICLSTVTDPTFEPYSNICPITAYTEGEIEVRGKNLVEGKIENSYIAYNGMIAYIQGYDMHIARVKEGATYTITSNEGLVAGFFETKPTAVGVVSYNGSRVDVANKTFVAPIDGYVAFRTEHNYATPQCELGTSATPYEPYTSTTHTTTYSSAIYRGSEDVVNGEVRTEWPVIDLGSLEWRDTSDGWTQSPDILSDILPCANNEKAHIISDRYETETSNVVYSRVKASICVSANKIIQLYDPSFANMTGAQIASALQGSQLAYELATPTTSSVTPTNLPIKSLNGYTHIESSTGDMEIEYITEEYQPIVDLIESNKHVYSTAEQIVGTWIDGKTVYEKTVVNEMALSQTWTNYMDASDIDTIISVEERCERDGEDVPAPFSFNEVASWIRRDNYIKVCITSNSSDWKILSLTIRYTKATTQTRSLSLSKGEISGEKKKVDETPIEEEKPVENDLDEWLEDSEEIEEEVDEGTDEDSDVIEEEEENEATNE